jgi:hypothetical protein
VVNALQFDAHISHFTFDEAIAFAGEMQAETTYFTISVTAWAGMMMYPPVCLLM